MDQVCRVTENTKIMSEWFFATLGHVEANKISYKYPCVVILFGKLTCQMIKEKIDDWKCDVRGELTSITFVSQIGEWPLV